jgi:hypothetical protein
MAGQGAGKQLAVALSAGPAAGTALPSACAGAARIGQTPGACAYAALLAVWRVRGDRQPAAGGDGDRCGGLAWG